MTTRPARWGKSRRRSADSTPACCYFRLQQPDFGSVLYFQNLTALNDYFRATNTKPDGAVGGEWPELGYLPPTPPQSGTPPIDPLPAGKEIMLSDALIVFHDVPTATSRQWRGSSCRLLGAVYRRSTCRRPNFATGSARAERTLRDLDRRPKATIAHYGHRYVHPYTAAEYPDSMVQLSVLSAIHDYEAWTASGHPLEAESRGGLGKFYDPQAQDAPPLSAQCRRRTRTRTRSTAGISIIRCSISAAWRSDGDAQARRLFLKSIDFGIKAAHHFDYHWPIQYNVTDFSVISRGAQRRRPRARPMSAGSMPMSCCRRSS